MKHASPENLFPDIGTFPEADPILTRRRYRFPLVNRALEVGRRPVTVRILTREVSQPAPEPMTLFIDVVDSVAIVPNPLVIRQPSSGKGGSLQVKVIRRGGGALNAKVADYNHDLLDVNEAKPTTTSVATFDILPIAKSDVPAETEVVFDVGEDKTRKLKLRFESSLTP